MTGSGVRLVVWVTVLVIVIIQRIVVARSKRRLQHLEDRATNDLVERARTLAAVAVKDLPEGQVTRVLGEVRARETLESPLDKRPCVAYRILVSTLAQAEGAQWELVSEDHQGTPFVVADASGECLVDPETAAFALDQNRGRTFKRGQPLPHDVAAYCVARGLSLDDLRTKSIDIVQQILPTSAKVSIAGIGHRVARSSSGERDYRASEPTWIAFDARAVELLIATQPKLLRTEATRTGDVEWPGTKHARGEAIGDDFEDKIIAERRRRQRLMTIVPLALVAGLGGVLVWNHVSRKTPDVVTDAERDVLTAVVDTYRIAAYRSDDGWRTALEQRASVMPGSAPCPDVRGDELFAVIAPGGELPLQSPRTTDVLRTIDLLERSIEIVKKSTLQATGEKVATQTFATRDVLIQQDGQSTIAWMYDHDKRRIACATDLVATMLSPADAIRELRAVP